MFTFAGCTAGGRARRATLTKTRTKYGACSFSLSAASCGPEHVRMLQGQGQFLSKTHTLGSVGPPTMVVSHRFRVDVVSTDARFVAGFTLARGHSVRLMAPEHVTWDSELCSSSLVLSEGGA